MKAQTKRIILYIAIAAVILIGGIAAILIAPKDMPVSSQEHIDLGHTYLIELSYDKAVLEFTEAIEIEPMNADAYLGLAEAYAGMGDIPKAVEVLESGYDKTGDERLKNMLEELLPPDSEELTTVSTVAMATVPNLLGLTEAEAISACESAGLKYVVSYGYSDEVKKGYVIRQSISGNAFVMDEISVTFTVSKGIKAVTTVETTVPVNAQTVVIQGYEIKTDITELYLIGYKTYFSHIDSDNKYLLDEPLDDLEFISHFENLTTLEIFQNNISDLSPLSTLVNLKRLNLGGNPISDLSPLSNLTNLEELELRWNSQITNLSPLSKCKNLKRIDIFDIGNIDDLSPLSELNNLEYLRLSWCGVNDISSLVNLTNLKELQISSSDLTDLSPLISLKNLEKLTIQYTNTDDSINIISEIENALPNCEIKISALTN